MQRRNVYGRKRRRRNPAIEPAFRHVLQACSFSVSPASSTPSGVAHAACTIIRENCTRAISTANLADEIGVHRSHLIRAFGSLVGLAPQTYIRQVRVAVAWELICAGLTLSQAAQTLDFCDQAHLAREFKKVVGVPPGTLYRATGRGRPEAIRPCDANPVQDGARWPA